MRDGDGNELFAWLEEQGSPLECDPDRDAREAAGDVRHHRRLKALALPERARIDTTTLTVRRGAVAARHDPTDGSTRAAGD